MDPGQRGNLIFTVARAVNAASTVQDDAQVLAGLLTSEKAQQWVLEQGLAIPSRTSLADNAFLSGDSNAAVASRMVFDGQSDGNVQPYYFGEYPPLRVRANGMPRDLNSTSLITLPGMRPTSSACRFPPPFRPVRV